MTPGEPPVGVREVSQVLDLVVPENDLAAARGWSYALRPDGMGARIVPARSCPSPPFPGWSIERRLREAPYPFYGKTAIQKNAFQADRLIGF